MKRDPKETADFRRGRRIDVPDWLRRRARTTGRVALGLALSLTTVEAGTQMYSYFAPNPDTTTETPPPTPVIGESMAPWPGVSSQELPSVATSPERADILSATMPAQFVWLDAQLNNPIELVGTDTKGTSDTSDDSVAVPTHTNGQHYFDTVGFYKDGYQIGLGQGTLIFDAHSIQNPGAGTMLPRARYEQFLQSLQASGQSTKIQIVGQDGNTYNFVVDPDQIYRVSEQGSEYPELFSKLYKNPDSNNPYLPQNIIFTTCSGDGATHRLVVNAVLTSVNKKLANGTVVTVQYTGTR